MTFRKCIGCGTVKDRAEMIRIMKLHNTGELVLNPNSRHFGRSYYLCYNIECIKKVLQKNKLKKILKRDVPQQILEYLERIKQGNN